MLVVLPVAALGACVLAIKGRLACWREAILGGAVVWGVVLVCATEVLSFFHTLTVFSLAAFWLLVVAVGAVLVLRTSSYRRLRLVLSVRSMDRLSMAIVGALVVMVLLLGVIAVVSPPNTWDSMTYHMARLIHWYQNASVNPYPTHILRQLYLQPGAEFVVFHLQILSAGDRLSGLVQWASMIGVLVGTSLIAHELGAGRSGALCASIFAASLPIGILESTSTQNDYVVAFWIVCATAFALRLIRSPVTNTAGTRAAAFGASVGLALLTKATAYVVLFPVLVWVGVWLFRSAGWRGFRLWALAGAIALTLNAGYYARNQLVFGAPTGPLDEGAPSLRYVNDGYSAPLLASNLIRDVGVNLNATPVAAVNVQSVSFVRLVHAWMGVDIKDPRTTWGQELFSQQPVGLAFDENFASNPLHLTMLLLALAGLWRLRRACGPTSVAYALMIIGGFLLFTGVLRWQPWNTRLELPFFVLAAPLVGLVAERVAPRLAVLTTGVLLVSMVPWVAYNQARPLVGPRSILGFTRAEQYFTNRPGMRSAYLDTIRYLVQRECTRIGFVSTVDGWEYPLWPLLATALPGPVQIEHVGVDNVSAARAGATTRPFEACAIVVLGPNADVDSVEVDGKRYLSASAHLDPDAVLEQITVFTLDHR